MPTWYSLVFGLLWLLIWVDVRHITAVRMYDDERMSHLRDEVKSIFYHAYDSYIQHAYPFDELRPLTCDGVDTWGSYSLTLIDTLDTLAILGNYSEFRRVAQLIIDNAHFDMNINVSVFETNIRIIGGLLSAHLLSQKAGMELDKGWPCNGPLLHLAEKVARKLLPAFDTATGMPYGTVNLRYGVPSKETPITCTAGVGTFIVEFGALSRLTGDPLYEQVALRALHSLYAKRSKLDLFGNHIDTETGKWTAIDSGIGAGVDSYFEYLLKGAVLLQRPELMHMFRVSQDAIHKWIWKNGWFIWATMGQGHVSTTTFQSLEAFWPGLLSLVGEFQVGLKAITNYHRIWKQYGGLPELYNIVQGKASHNREGYPLRPELVESAMYLYRATGNPFMLEIGEDIMHGIAHTSRTECGFGTIRDVTSLTLEDRMESFFLAETIKYLYLLFDSKNFIHSEGDDATTIQNPLGECTVYAGGYIFNTEAHPIDPSALQCCTGITERDLDEEISKIDEWRVAPKFHGRVKSKISKRKREASNQAGPPTIKIKTPISPSEQDSPPQLIPNSQPVVQLQPPPGSSSVSSSLLFDYNMELGATFDDSTTDNTCEKPEASFLKLKNDLHICKKNERKLALRGSLDEKVSALENLLNRLLEEHQKGNVEIAPQVNFLGTGDLNAKSGYTTIKEESKKLENLIQSFETLTKPSPSKSTIEIPKKKKLSSKTGNADSNRIQPAEEQPDLDLIFGTPETGKSLSFYFSLKWLQKFPELITQLIPAERFDMQNFYSRMSSHFSTEGFVRDFNLSLDWTKDYEKLRCDSVEFRDRFMFHRSSGEDL